MTGWRGEPGSGGAGRGSGAGRGADDGRGHGVGRGDDTWVEPAPLEARFDAPEPIDLRLTLGPLRNGRDDPTVHFGADGFWLAWGTAAGPASLRIWTAPDDAAIHAQSWGPGAELSLAAVPGLVGLLDEPEMLVAQHPLVRDLQRRFGGLRLPRSGQLLAPLIAAITGQKVTASEALAAYAALVNRLGEPAPGPVRLRLSPAGAALAALPYFEFHPMGLERRRAELLRSVGRLQSKIEGYLDLSAEDARSRLRLIPGIGPWTAAKATEVAFGDPDAVSLGDAHLPDLVSWALAAEPRGSDARMLELLAPYAGQRGRVIRLLQVAGIKIPRFGPRFTPGHIERI